jgi:hypothetical protein
VTGGSKGTGAAIAGRLTEGGATDMLRLLTETIASGRGFRPAGDVESFTGETPMSFADFVRRSARYWRGQS